jgi:hypothetical protein
VSWKAAVVLALILHREYKSKGRVIGVRDDAGQWRYTVRRVR